jgi:hypothetical protein
MTPVAYAHRPPAGVDERMVLAIDDASKAPSRGDGPMTTRDDRTPSPTDPPLDPLATEPVPDRREDTEGHSQLNAEFGRTVARDHMREADRIARDSARVHEARSGRDGGFLKRFSRR